MRRMLLVALAAVSAPALGEPPAAPGKGALAPRVLAAIDSKADPCQDFYRYACGGWLAQAQLPPDQSRWGRGFSEVHEQNQRQLRDILDEAVRDPGRDPGLQRVGALDRACMDEDAVEKAGAAPLAPFLEQIASIKDRAGFMTVAGQMHSLGIPVVFVSEVAPDFKEPAVNIAHFRQDGLGLPERDYYLRGDRRSRGIVAEYRSHIARMFQLLGEENASAERRATAVLEFETSLAQVSAPRSELRDPAKTYHRLDLEGLRKLAGDLAWDSFLKGAGAPGLTQINIATPGYFEGAARLIRETNLDTLQAYLRWRLLQTSADLLSRSFVETNFDFYGRILAGQKEIAPRWRRCATAVDAALGDALGKAYVQRYFPGDSKPIAQDMIQRVEAAFGEDLRRLAWMDDKTRGEALRKLKAVANKVGYPDTWIDCSALEIRPDDYFGDVLRARQFAFRREIAKLGQKVDRTEWRMTPPTVNAYYNPLANEMVFPAGILQPPFFSRSDPAPVNFGGVGMVMGHELTHGFDDLGRKFDGEGRLADWWRPEMSEKFEQNAQCIEQLYLGFEVQEGLKLNGALTLGENIADFAGLKLAFEAYRQWAKEHAGGKPAVEGLTDEQLFFVSFAQTWCTLATPESERMLAAVDSHSPPRFRVNAPLANLPAFAQAFSCREGAPMRPKNICAVW